MRARDKLVLLGSLYVAQGLPFGLQLAGRFGADEVLLPLAAVVAADLAPAGE